MAERREGLKTLPYGGWRMRHAFWLAPAYSIILCGSFGCAQDKLPAGSGEPVPRLGTAHF